MSADINTLVNKIIADAEQKVRTDLIDISSKAKRDFVAKAKEVVMLYYSHYPKPPRIYERTNNLRDNVVDDDLSFVALNGNGYDAWVQFNSVNMSDYDMGNKDVVVANFMYGIHGRKSIFVEKNPAMDLMDDFQNNYKKTLDNYFINLGYTVK
jgi:hypothetical protein